MRVGLCAALLAIAFLHSLGTRAEAAEATTGGLLVANVSATTWINLPTARVTPGKILGGDLAFSLTTPFGEPRVNAALPVNSLRFGPIGVSASDANFDMSDFFRNSFIGWHAGNFQWQPGDTGGQIAAAKPIKTKF